MMESCGYKCYFCGNEASEVHHIRPRQLKGSDHPGNLIPLCELCHDEIHRRYDQAFKEAIKSSMESMGGIRQMNLIEFDE